MALTDQTPLNAGFDATSGSEDVLAGIDLTGKTVIVTGGYSGLGFETTRALAGHGARVVVPARSAARAEAALAELGDSVSTATMDLADIASVRAFAQAFTDDHDKLDLLINNAGVMASPEGRVGPGWESQFGINHMGHFALTKALMPMMAATDGARVVALSSMAHRNSDIRWDDIHYRTEPYEKWKAYGQSKTANALFANALSRRLKPTGGLAFSLHPGAIFTPLQRHLPKEEQIAMGWLGEDGEPSEMAQANFKTPDQGCATTLWAATSARLEGRPGVYCEDCDVSGPTADMPGRAGVDPHATNDESAERLWAMSEAMLAEA
ncbi:MAG TPA: oxidoreductase [Rhodobacteraceae bacterium]|nr:oxidoreductase [Paracoccaceae bacterium]